MTQGRSKGQRRSISRREHIDLANPRPDMLKLTFNIDADGHEYPSDLLDLTESD
ncbi:hypothetical protein [Nocardia terpenica]|uniref:Uncharacterized protein n=1 Tax=Nocardia terpenica TaxID=455432 RepID=A0A6G9YZD8_9NOCA|nr:hypothetical protein [Nocardia terpenica]QIS18572.1 hypothetical protein F6W96_09970 [Nocardia terpenica]